MIAHDVVVGLLRGQRRAGGLGVEAQRPAARVARLEPILHGARPEAARRAELGHLLDEIVVYVEEEAQPPGEGIGVQAAPHRRVDVGDAVAQRESDLLRSGRAGLADVVARDGDRVPFGNHL